MATFFVRIGGKKYGPVDTDKLKRLAQAGKLTRDDFVSRDGQGGWVPAANVKGLFAAAELLPAVLPRPKLPGTPPPLAEPIPTLPMQDHMPPPTAIPTAAPPQPQIIYVQAPAAAAPQQIIQQTTVVVHGQQGNTLAALALLVAVGALCFCWIPLLGLLCIPFAVVAIFLAGLAGLLALFRRGAGLVNSVVAVGLALLAITLSLASTGAAAKATVDALQSEALALREANNEAERLLDETDALERQTGKTPTDLPGAVEYQKVFDEYQTRKSRDGILAGSKWFCDQVRGKHLADFAHPQ